jgi:hypothetical protein
MVKALGQTKEGQQPAASAKSRNIL